MPKRIVNHNIREAERGSAKKAVLTPRRMNSRGRAEEDTDLVPLNDFDLGRRILWLPEPVRMLSRIPSKIRHLVQNILK